MDKIKKLKIVLLFFVLLFYNNASQNLGVLLIDNDSAEEIKDFDKITLDDAAEAYYSAANNACSKFKIIKNPGTKSADYYKWMAESYKMGIFKILKNLATTSQEQEKKQLFENIKVCIECYEKAYSKYKEQTKMKTSYFCGCNLGCDFCIVEETIDEKDVNYALAMEMNAKKEDMSLLLSLNGYAENAKYDPEQSWEKVKNTKPSYHKYALAKQKEIDYYMTNCTDEKLDEVISAWGEVLIDKKLIKSFRGRKSSTWKAYESFANRKIVTFKFLKDRLFPKDNNNKTTIDPLKEAFIDNYEKDIIAYNETKNKVFKAFAYEAAALYNSREFFEGFYHLPIQENLNL